MYFAGVYPPNRYAAATSDGDDEEDDDDDDGGWNCLYCGAGLGDPHEDDCPKASGTPSAPGE